MKYKTNELVTLPKIRPKDANTNNNPGWNAAMDRLLGQTLPISRINRLTNPPTYCISNWWWSEHWLNNTSTSLTLEERICNKIKQLDTKWKERNSKFA